MPTRLRQLDIGDAAVVLQLFQDLAVDGVETGGHGRWLLPGSWRTRPGKFIPRNNVSRKNIAQAVAGPAP